LKKKPANYSCFLLLALLLASCSSTTEVIKPGPVSEAKRELFDAHEFIREHEARIEKNVGLGPHVDRTQEEIDRSRERIRINEELPTNYVSMQNDDMEYFPISVNFDNIGIRDAMNMLMEVTGTNIILGEEVTGSISAHMQDVPWNIALESMLKIKGLAHHVDSKANITRIHSQATLLSQEAFDRKRLEDLQKTIQAERAIKPLYTELFKLYYSDAETISAQITGILSDTSSAGEGEGSSSSSSDVGVTIDARTNSLIVKATKNELDLIARFINEIDVRTPQILIEAFIVEATDDFKKELGSRLGYDQPFFGRGNDGQTTFGVSGMSSGTAAAADGVSLGSAAGSIAQNLVVAGATGGIGGLLTTSSMTLKIELNAMQADGFTKILSNPRVYTLNNQKAIIKQGWEIPYKTESESGGTDIEMKEAMLSLSVTPSIVGDGNVRLDIVLEKKDADETQINPPMQSENITTKLMVKDRTIVVIGGVRKQKTVDLVDQVPFFGDIPFLGNAFKHRKDQDKFEELLVFIAPRII